MDDLQVAARLDRVRERITTACVQAGRPEDSVQLIAVTKRIALPLVVQACQAGQWCFGENRVQDALRRQTELAASLASAGLDPDSPRWHFIGHLQRNKANRAAGRFDLIHGVDSTALGQQLARRCHTDSIEQPILLEVNISGETQKNGVAPAEVVEVVAALSELSGVQVVGLMGMARRDDNAGQLGRTFTRLRRLAEEARTATGLRLPQLSMGMSGDYEIAIAEGATIVRVGSAIFGPRAD